MKGPRRSTLENKAKRMGWSLRAVSDETLAWEAAQGRAHKLRWEIESLTGSADGVVACRTLALVDNYLDCIRFNGGLGGIGVWGRMRPEHM